MSWWKRLVGKDNIVDYTLRDSTDVILHITLAMITVRKWNKRTFDVFGGLFMGDPVIRPIISDLSKEEKKLAEYETVVLVMSIVICKCLEKGVSFEILDEYRDRLSNVLTKFGFLKNKDDQVRLTDLFVRRYETYEEALQSQRVQRFAALAYKNLFGIDVGQDANLAFTSVLSMGSLLKFQGQAVEKIINDYNLGESTAK